MKNNNLATIYIVRHGRTSWNVEGRVQGHSDIPLNEEGEEQARKLGEELRHIDFDEAFSSDLLRAKRTAELILLEKKLAVKTTQALREQTYGKFEGRIAKELDVELKRLFDDFKKLSKEELMSRREDPTMETHGEVVSRFITFLREIAVTYPGKKILVATHGGVMRYFLIHLGYGDYVSMPPRSVRNTAYVIVESDGIDFFIKQTSGIHKVEDTE